jgi:glycosyltransferase involved in cell wall biosynthesis
MMPYLPSLRSAQPGCPIVYDAHNAEMALQRTMFTAELRDPRRWHAGLYSMAQWSKLGSYERIMMNQTDMVLAVSDEDVNKLRGRHVEPELVPNAVDTTTMEYRQPGREANGTLLFVGSLDYRPNADALGWFIRKVFPKIRAISSAQLRVVGIGSDTIGRESIAGLGYLEDIGPELRRADVMIVPMRMGSGVRFKVLEAMAVGVPVVSTPIGLQGIAAEHERHALVARTATEFAAATLRLLEDRDLARRMADAARHLVVERYDWTRITPRYLALLSRLRRGRR